LHCTDNINALPLQRIGNNVEAFRYYLVLKSRQFQLTKIVAKWLPALMLLYICL